MSEASARSTARSVASSKTRNLTSKRNRLEDQIWNISHRTGWRQAQTGIRARELSRDADPNEWLTNGAKLFMSNRYKSTTMADFVGFDGQETFSPHTTITENRRKGKEFSKYAKKLSGVAGTLRGNF